MTNPRHHREPTCAQKSAATLYLRHFKTHATYMFFLRHFASVPFACTYVLRALHIDCRFCITTFTRHTVASNMPLAPCLSRPSCSLPQRRIRQPARSPAGAARALAIFPDTCQRQQADDPPPCALQSDAKQHPTPRALCTRHATGGHCGNLALPVARQNNAVQSAMSLTDLYKSAKCRPRRPHPPPASQAPHPIRPTPPAPP